MREAVVAQGWKRSSTAQRPRACEAQAQAELRLARELAFRGDLVAARKRLAETRRRHSGPATGRPHHDSREDRKKAPRRERGSPAPFDSAEASWLDAYIACARGDFVRALGLAVPLAASAPDPGLRARAAVTAGSALRQTSRHAEARDLETRALRASPPQERAHILAGLAADAAGLGDARECERRLRDAEASLPARDWRVRVRLDWVRCELALLRNDPRAAARAARSARRRSARAGAVRHEAKSWLFLGVSLREAGERGHGAALARAIELSRACGAREIERVARRLS